VLATERAHALLLAKIAMSGSGTLRPFAAPHQSFRYQGL